ncbi:MAG: hypothetical protein U5J99_01065 [Parvularculaceae bacterium]|nr:hypothetical protein [Parvularculaceae bacterium]
MRRKNHPRGEDAAANGARGGRRRDKASFASAAIAQALSQPLPEETPEYSDFLRTEEFETANGAFVTYVFFEVLPGEKAARLRETGDAGAHPRDFRCGCLVRRGETAPRCRAVLPHCRFDRGDPERGDVTEELKRSEDMAILHKRSQAITRRYFACDARGRRDMLRFVRAVVRPRLLRLERSAPKS